MALIPIIGQPVNLTDNTAQQQPCNGDGSYCVLYNKSIDSKDAIMFEMRQTPCDDSIITNGTFDDDTDWVYDTNIIFNQNKVTHLVGTTGEISQDLSAVLLKSYYQVKLTVTGMSAGSIYVDFTGSSATITTNGTYTFYLFDVNDNDNITFGFSADCDGSISQVSAYGLIDNTEAATIATLSTLDGVFTAYFVASVIDDYIIFRAATTALDEGCYNVTVIDPCIDLGQLTEVFEDSTFDNAGDWTTATNAGIAPTVSGGKLLSPADYLGKVSSAVQPFNIPINTKLIAIAKIVTGTRFTTDVATIKTDLTDICQFGSIGIALPQNTTLTKAFIIPSELLDVSTLDMGVELQDSFDTYPIVEPNPTYVSGDNNELLEVSLMVAPASQVTGVFTSNCIAVRSNMEGTSIVEGFAEEVNAFPLGNRSLGFMFLEDYFWLRARIGVQFSNPHIPIKTENALFSSGLKKKIYAQVGKAYDLTFVAADENMHDTIANIINCDRFLIEGNEYITDEKEYTANYGPKGVNTVGESTIEVQRIESTRFNTNA